MVCRNNKNKEAVMKKQKLFTPIEDGRGLEFSKVYYRVKALLERPPHITAYRIHDAFDFVAGWERRDGDLRPFRKLKRGSCAKT